MEKSEVLWYQSNILWLHGAKEDIYHSCISTGRYRSLHPCSTPLRAVALVKSYIHTSALKYHAACSYCSVGTGEGAQRAPRPRHVLPYPPHAVVTWMGISSGASPAHWVKPICLLLGWEPKGWPSQDGLKQQQADLMHVWHGNPHPIVLPEHQQAQQWRHCSLSGGKLYG